MKKKLSLLLGAIVATCSFYACAENKADTEDKNRANGVTETGRESTTGCIGNVSTFSVTARYDYFHIEGRATMLYDYILPFFNLPEGIDYAVAGDVFNIVHTGEIVVQESYPARAVLKDGEIVQVYMQKAQILRLTYYAPYNGADEYFEWIQDNGVRERIPVKSRPDYYIYDIANGGYHALSDVEYSTTLYASYSSGEDGYDGGYVFSGLYSWHPRYTERDVHPDTQATIDELNEKSDFTFDLLSKKEDCDFSGYEYNPGFGCESYTKDGVRYEFTAYPDYASGDYCITSILSEHGNVVFGIKDDAMSEKVADTLLSYGYMLTTNTETQVSGSKYGVNVTYLKTESGWSVRVGLHITNDTGIVY